MLCVSALAGRAISTRPRCPHGAARVVPGTSKLFARTLSSSIVRHKLIIKKRNSCVDQTELFCCLCCCVILGTHVGVWPSAAPVPNSPSGPLQRTWGWGAAANPSCWGCKVRLDPLMAVGPVWGSPQVPVMVALLCGRVHGQLAEGSRSAMAECTLTCSGNAL